MPFNILRALASLNPDYAAAQQHAALQRELANMEGERQRAHDERTAAANLAERRAMTDEALRLEQSRDDRAQKEMQQFLAQTYIAQGMPVDAAFNKAAVDFAKYRSLAGIQAPTSKLSADKAANDLARERSMGALPYADARAGMEEQAAAANAMAGRDASVQKIKSIAATDPYVQELAQRGAESDIAGDQNKTAQANLARETAEGSMGTARRLSSLKGLTDLANMQYDQPIEALHRAALAAKYGALVQDPTLNFPAVLSAETRANATMHNTDRRYPENNDLFGGAGAQGQPKVLSLEELKKRAAIKNGATQPAAVSRELPSSIKALIEQATTPHQYFTPQ